MARTAVFDPIVVEPHVTPDKVRELVERRSESAKLDYKLTYAAHAGRRFRLVKHVLAMANTAGGYIVVGVDNKGQLVGLQPAIISELDEAKVRAQVAAATLVPIPLFVNNTVEHNGCALAIVTILPLNDRLAVATIDAQYQNAEGKPQFAFRKGDVLVRHGSASEPWHQDDSDFVLERLTRAARQRWREEFAADNAEVLRIMTGRQGADVSAKAFDKSPEDFRDLAVQLLRADNG